MHTKEEKLNAFSRLLDVMDSLRERCPWNAAQTMDTIRPMTEEEVYELSDAIIRKDMPDVAKEIGDLLYHMVFYARIAQESGDFDIADVRPCLRKEADCQGYSGQLGACQGQGEGWQQNHHVRDSGCNAGCSQGFVHAGEGAWLRV